MRFFLRQITSCEDGAVINEILRHLNIILGNSASSQSIIQLQSFFLKLPRMYWATFITYTLHSKFPGWKEVALAGTFIEFYPTFFKIDSKRKEFENKTLKNFIQPTFLISELQIQLG